MRALKGFLISMTIFYLILSFIKGEFNPFVWDTIDRAVIVAVSLFAGLMNELTYKQ